VFDKAILKDGQEVPLNAAIQALASGQSTAIASANDTGVMNGAGGSAMGAITGTVTTTGANAGNNADGALNSTVRTATPGAAGGLNATGPLTSGSRGVFGLQGVNLSSATTGAVQGSVIRSAGKNLHLRSGTQVLLLTQAAGSTETPKP